jgi:septal ring factor EnvC (AmiA/AmiB activator)
MDKRKAIAALEQLISNMQATSALLAQQRADLENMIQRGENISRRVAELALEQRAAMRFRTF